MVFEYICGMIAFVILFFGLKGLIEFLDPKPPLLPLDREDEQKTDCFIFIDGMRYRARKVIKNRYTYSYDADQNAIEYKYQHIIYHVKGSIGKTDLKISVYDGESRETIECYAGDKGRILVNYYPIFLERLYIYRKHIGNKKTA